MLYSLLVANKYDQNMAAEAYFARRDTLEAIQKPEIRHQKEEQREVSAPQQRHFVKKPVTCDYSGLFKDPARSFERKQESWKVPESYKNLKQGQLKTQVEQKHKRAT